MKRRNRNIQITVIGAMAAVNLTALTSIVLAGNTLVPPGLGYASVLAIVAAMLPSMSGNSAEEQLLPLRAGTMWGRFLLALASAMFLTGCVSAFTAPGQLMLTIAPPTSAFLTWAFLWAPELLRKKGTRTNGSDGSPDGAKP